MEKVPLEAIDQFEKWDLMAFRVRRRGPTYTESEVFRIHANGMEVPSPLAQELWASALERASVPNSPEGPARVYIQVNADVHADRILSVDFMDSCCRYVLQHISGVTQWHLELLPGFNKKDVTQTCYVMIDTQVLDSKHRGFGPCIHPFFYKKLAPVRPLVYRYLESMRRKLCDLDQCSASEPRHNHYQFHIRLKGFDWSDLRHTEHVVCGNRPFFEIFNTLCRDKLDARFALIDLEMLKLKESKKDIKVRGDIQSEEISGCATPEGEIITTWLPQPSYGY